MPKSMSNASARRELLERLERLTPQATPMWGRMNASQMLAHLTNWMLMASGEIVTAPKKRMLRYPPIKQFVVYWLPWPKGVPTAPELISRTPSEWNAERAAVRQSVESFEQLYLKGTFPEHPAFGWMTPRAWGVLGYRHMDHHLRQFGI